MTICFQSNLTTDLQSSQVCPAGQRSSGFSAVGSQLQPGWRHLQPWHVWPLGHRASGSAAEGSHWQPASRHLTTFVYLFVCLFVFKFFCPCSLHRSVQEDRGHLGQLQWGHTHSRVGDIWSILFTIGVTNIFFTLINKYTVHLPATLTGLTEGTKLIRIFCSGITLASRLQTSEILRIFFFLEMLNINHLPTLFTSLSNRTRSIGIFCIGITVTSRGKTPELHFSWVP